MLLKDKFLYFLCIILFIAQRIYFRFDSSCTYLLGISTIKEKMDLDLVSIFVLVMPIIMLLIIFMDNIEFYLNNYGRFLITRNCSLTSILIKIEKRIVLITLALTLLQYLINMDFTKESFQLLVSYYLYEIMLVNILMLLCILLPSGLSIAIITACVLCAYYNAYYHIINILIPAGKFIKGKEYLANVGFSAFMLTDILLPLLISGLCLIILQSIYKNKDLF